MIKPEMVPTCVAEKLRRMVYDFETNEYVLIAAALNAWPGMESKNTCGSYPPFPHIVLPFPTPKEASDA